MPFVLRVICVLLLSARALSSGQLSATFVKQPQPDVEGLFAPVLKVEATDPAALEGASVLLQIGAGSPRAEGLYGPVKALISRDGYVNYSAAFRRLGVRAGANGTYTLDAVFLDRNGQTPPSRFKTFQQIDTSGGHGMTAFQIGDRRFLAVANSLRIGGTRIKSDIYVLNAAQTKFELFQQIDTQMARAMTAFTVGGRNFLAVANAHNGATGLVKSDIYVMNAEQTKFEIFQRIDTKNAHGVAALAAGTRNFLAFAYKSDDITPIIKSDIFVLNALQTEFNLFQQIDTKGAYGVTAFSAGGQSFLGVVNTYDDRTHNLKSDIYVLNVAQTEFTLFQQIDTQGGRSMTAFTAGGRTFLAVANHRDNVSYRKKSRIYVLNAAQTKFELFQEIDTQGAVNMAAFVAHSNHFLAVTNYFDGGNYKIKSDIYMLNAAQTQFDLFQQVDTQGASGVAAIAVGDRTFLSFANYFDSSAFSLKSPIFEMPPATIATSTPFSLQTAGARLRLESRWEPNGAAIVNVPLVPNVSVSVVDQLGNAVPCAASDVAAIELQVATGSGKLWLPCSASATCALSHNGTSAALSTTGNANFGDLDLAISAVGLHTLGARAVLGNIGGRCATGLGLATSRITNLATLARVDVGCSACAPGFTCPPGLPARGCPAGSACVEGVRYLCPTGKYQPEHGQAGCSLCAPGYYQDAVGQAECKACVNGQSYQNEFAAVSCKTCGSCPNDGEWRKGCGHDNAGICKLCEAGSYYDPNVKPLGTNPCKSCELGKYQDQQGKRNCKPCNKCPEGVDKECTATSDTTCISPSTCEHRPNSQWEQTSRDCLCNVGFYWNASRCLSFPRGGTGMSCPRRHCVPRNFILKKGYWRTHADSTDVLACRAGGACVGNGTCAPGHTGRLCTACENGWALTAGARCVKCTSSQRTALYVVLVLVVILALAMTTALCVRATGVRCTVRAWNLDKKAEQSLMTKLKLVVMFMQILSQLNSTYDIPFPQSFVQFARHLSFLNLNQFFVLHVGCFVDHDFYDTLLATAVTPLAFCGAMILIAKVYAKVYASWFKADVWPHVWQRSLSLCMYISFLVFPAVSTTALRAYPCRHFDDGWFLKADLEIKCENAWAPPRLLGWAVLITIVYPLGIPLTYLWLLWSIRGKRCSHHVKNEQTEASKEESQREAHDSRETERCDKTKVIAFLTDPYEEECWWFEVFECARRLMLTGGTVFVLEGSATQIAFGILVAVASLSVYTSVRPYADDTDLHLAVFAQAAVFLTLLQGLLLKTNVADDDGYSNDAVAVALIAMNSAVLIFAVTTVWTILRRDRTGTDQSSRKQTPEWSVAQDTSVQQDVL